MTPPNPEPEFSRPIPVERLGAAEIAETIEASPQERERLAKRFGIVSLDRFDAAVRLQRREGGIVRVAGRFEADVVQKCVVTLEPFPSHIEDSFTADFTQAAAEPVQDLSLDADYDAPEPIEGGAIDIGELAAQFLSLALDPHPRAPGAELETGRSDPDVAKQSPFAVLEKLKSPS